MAPSRGVTSLRYSYLKFTSLHWRRHSTFARVVTNPAHKTQVYLSRTLNPYLNLSIEHFLLQRSPSNSTILFLYTNRPCIVIGRNQNPWAEVNLGLVNECGGLNRSGIGTISLIRRRSGGGTVFHDEGNVNYSIICPTAAFDRDKHAQMVVRGLHQLGVTNAKVNERHDIVLEHDGEQNHHEPSTPPSVTRTTLAQVGRKPLKISGSAFKLTRLRSLHHGTCLLSSPNINHISQYLRSSAKPYIKARGVDSVSSPIANVNLSNEAFEKAVVAEFCKMYGPREPVIVTDEAIEIPEVAKGLAEMISLEWTYMQTPQFTFSSHEANNDICGRPTLPDYFPPDASLSFTARNGTILEAKLAISQHGDSPMGAPLVLDTSAMIQRRLHTISDWREVIPEPIVDGKYSISRWLNGLFGNGLSKESNCV